MKNSKILIIIFLFYSYSFGQELNKFIKTEVYYLTEIDSTARIQYWNELSNNNNKNKTFSIFLKNKEEEIIYEFTIKDLENYDQASVTLLATKQTKEVLNVIKVEIDYSVCCTNSYSTYFIQKKNGNFIKLPEIENLYCDGPEPFFEYRFPNQKFGVKNKILLTKSYLNNNYEVIAIEVLKTYNWNGKLIDN